MNNNLLAYYITKFGKPTRRAEFVSPEKNKVQVCKWDGDQTNEGVTMYATIGANKVLGDSTNSCEFFIGISPEVDDIVEALAEVALHGNGRHAIPKSGDSITLSYHLWKETKANSFLFTDGQEILPSFIYGDKKIEFIQLVPLFLSELDYKKKYGEEKLWEMFESKLTPYWSSNRSAAL
jgi:Suppressor of fused protein (SUFU)